MNENTTAVAEKVTNASLAVLLPPELKALLQEDAETSNTSAMAIVRGMIADKYGFTLVPTQRGGTARRKYATPEERETAQKAQAKTRREKLSTLLEMFEGGQIVSADGSPINLDEMVAAKVAADEAKAAEAAAAKAATTETPEA